MGWQEVLIPTRKVLIATDAIRRAVAKSKQMTVTVAPVVRAGTSECHYDDVFKFDRISVRTYV